MCKIVHQKAMQLYTGLKKIKDPDEIFTFQTFHLALLTPEILCLVLNSILPRGTMNFTRKPQQ